MIAVTCAIIINDNKFLITRRSGKMSMPLLWEFPGGKVENDESKEECIVREIKEELNISIDIISQLPERVYDYGDFKIQLIPFLANYVSGILDLAEHKEYRWIELTELNNFDWVPADVSVVKDVLEMFSSSV